MIAKAAKQAPELLAAAAASAMWTANAATVSPSADTSDGRVHFTPANLCSKLHRAIEHEATRRTLSTLFADPAHFAAHEALTGTPALGDEGAANHTRFCAEYGKPGIEFFVYGRAEYRRGPEPKRFPARQTFEASRAVAHRHGKLAEEATVYAQQDPDVIDAGVFHNDVISVGNRDTLFTHERAFVNKQAIYDTLTAALDARGARLNVIEVPEAAVSVNDAVTSYLFNSQLLSRADGSQVLVVPQECRENGNVAAYLDELAAGGLIHDVLVFDLRESMKNGGGPACLRLRVVLNEAERAAVTSNVWINDTLFASLDTWIDRHYRDRLAPEDLADPALLDESRTALDGSRRSCASVRCMTSSADSRMAGALLDDFLAFTLAGRAPSATDGTCAAGAVRWQWRGDGLLALEPVAAEAAGARASVLVSAGVHGDETAPIELLSMLVRDLASGALPLACRLLVVLGNVPAMRAGERYLDDDLNRLFSGRHAQVPDSREAPRAAQLEAAAAAFFAAAPAGAARWHIDMHTAIRASVFEQFALLPHTGMPPTRTMFEWLGDARIAAVLLHTAKGNTYSHFTAEHCGALACTLELGKVRPFGQNDYSALRAGRPRGAQARVGRRLRGRRAVAARLHGDRPDHEAERRARAVRRGRRRELHRVRTRHGARAGRRLPLHGDARRGAHRVPESVGEAGFARGPARRRYDPRDGCGARLTLAGCAWPRQPAACASPGHHSCFEIMPTRRAEGPRVALAYLRHRLASSTGRPADVGARSAASRAGGCFAISGRADWYNRGLAAVAPHHARRQHCRGHPTLQ